MGYLYLSLALVFAVIKGYCSKRSSHAALCTYDAVCINTIRMAFCIVIGVFLVCWDGVAIGDALSPNVLGISLLGGISTVGFTVTWLLAVRVLPYMLVSIFNMVGVLLTLVLCAIRYGEAVGPWQIVGIVLLLAAVYCMCTYQEQKDLAGGRLSVKNFLLLLACACFGGVSDFSQKLYAKECADVPVSIFNLFTYFFAALTLLIVLPFFRQTAKKTSTLRSPVSILRPILPYVAIMALSLFLNSYFKTLSAGQLDAVLLYPLNQGMSVTLSLLMSVVLFKEKINAKGLIGIGMGVIALILINVCKA